MGNTPHTDAELLAKARRGDVEAFGLLVECHQDYVFNVVLHMVGRRQDAEDITQDVFVKVHKALERFEGRAKFTTWLYGIAVNTVRNFWRSSARRATLPLHTTQDGESWDRDPSDPGDTPDEAAQRDERVAFIRRAIESLDEDLREAIVLRDIRGFAYEELAEALGVPLGTVKSRLHRGRAALKSKLATLYANL